MPDANGNPYTLIGYLDSGKIKPLFTMKEGASSWVGAHANDKMSSFAIGIDGVNRDDVVDLYNHPERLHIIGYEHDKYGGRAWDLSSLIEIRDGQLTIDYVGDDPNDQISSMRFSVDPAPASRLNALRAERNRQEAAAKKATNKQAREDARSARLARGLPSLELTVVGGGKGLFTAMSSSESQEPTGPHPGESVAGENFYAYSDNKEPEELGLPKALLAWDESAGIHVAKDEYDSTLLAAQKGNPMARAALESLGIQVTPAAPAPGSGGSGWGWGGGGGNLLAELTAFFGG